MTTVEVAAGAADAATSAATPQRRSKIRFMRLLSSPPIMAPAARAVQVGESHRTVDEIWSLQPETTSIV